MACEAKLGDGVSLKGNVRDVSEAGLAIVTSEPRRRPLPEQGEPVHVRLDPPGRPSTELEALIWHVHRVRKTSSGDVGVMLGLVLAGPCDGFFELLRELGSASTRGLGSRTGPTSAELASSPPPPTPLLSRYSVRVKQDGGPKSHRIVVAGASLEAAKENALAELGAGWTILEARRL